jgi:glucokinase
MAEKKAPGAQRLLIDLGASNARFALQSPGGEPERAMRLPVGAQPDLLSAIRWYLQQTGARPAAGAFAVASAITGDRVSLTNHPWSFSIAETRAVLGLAHLAVVNDFTAIALSLPRLGPGDVVRIGCGGAGRAEAPLAVLGPGTGLGASGLIPIAGGWFAIAGEGGHVTLPATDEREERVLNILRRRLGHVSAERAVSGQGLVNLYGALSEMEGRAAGDLTPAEIAEQGLAGIDATARETLDLFCALLGTVAGNHTLTLGALGGCFIAGGIVPKLGRFFFESRFRERFEAKGRFRAYLEPIPTWLVVRRTPAFLGLAQLLDQELGGAGPARSILLAHPPASV